MERVIVTIQRSDGSEAWDIEIPVETPVETLLREISLAFSWNDTCEVYAEPPGRVLSPDETLFQAGVWDGARLTFQPSGTTSFPQRGPSSVPSDRPSDQGPLTGWRPLDVSGPPTTPPQSSPQPTPSGGFVWRRIDED